MRVNKNVAHKERRRYSIDGFRGVDFASSQLACDPRRSPDAVNFIGDHGINRKRNGWEQVLDTLTGNIQCIHQVSDNVVLVITSSNAYKLEYQTVYTRNPGTDEDDIWGWVVVSISSDEASDRVTPIAFNNRILFIGAGALYYDLENGTYEKSDWYIPTTTINIDREGVEDQRAALDMPNLLTKLRKNTMRGYGQAAKYKLDEKISIERETAAGTFKYRPKNFQVEVKLSNTIKSGDIDSSASSYYTVRMYDDDHNEEKSSDGKAALYVKHPWVSDGYKNEYGDVTLEFNIQTFPTENLVSPIDNITVTYEPDNDSIVINPYLGSIGACYGIDGINDRLFLAGHPDHPNVIFFSEIDDPTYFPDQYTISVGSPNSKIIGMMRLNDGTMAVFKEPSASDVCLYYIKGSYRNQYDDAGNIKKVLPVFSVSASPFYEAPISSHAFTSIHGDNIFFAKDGIYAIEPEQNISADIRIARNRSSAITPRLAGEKIIDATCITHKNKCYFCYTTSDGENGCYVADAAYKYIPEGELSYNYEWWYLDNVPARVFAVVNDELWFGTYDGRICRFTDGYTDVLFNYFESGFVALYDANGDGEISGEEGMFQYNKNVGSVWENRRVRIMNKIAFFSSETTDHSQFDLYMFNIDTKNQTFRLSTHPVVRREDGSLETNPIPIKSVDFSEYNGIKMRAYIDTPVSAYWSTPPLDFGNDSLLKSMRSMTVTAESGTNSKFKFGYETRLGSMERNMEGTGRFDLENFDFNDISFETGFQNSFTVRANERNFNFIRFRIESDEAAPCAVHRISAEYKYNKKNRGVK